ncbi:MAG: RdgB/HAM1 family non-canonical purine NTP pyrophosphatase [Pseudomonadota bacterium]
MRRFAGPELILASHNAGKIDEMRALLDRHGIALSSAADHNLPEPAETGTTFVENARIKAHAAAKTTGIPALADDSGIEIDALGGAPGVYTADWAETPTGRDFALAMTRAHAALEDIGAAEPRIARFCCTLVLAWPDGHDEVFAGVMPGRVVWPMRGAHGHGYDPIFEPEGYDQTFGEMDRWEKNKISHRARAVALLEAALGA